MTLGVAEAASLPDIAERLEPALAVAITASRVRIALNGQLIAPGEVRAGNGDELAFLPPVSGG